MDKASENKSRSSGCMMAFLSILLGLCLALASALYQRQNDPACGGSLSAGFPLPYLCDETGGSPISSWGRIDMVELLGTNMRVFLLDLLLYCALTALIWTLVRGVLLGERKRFEDFSWGIVLGLIYIVAFLFAFLSFQSGRLDFKVPPPRTPTPILFTPTPFGTMPPPPITPPS